MSAAVSGIFSTCSSKAQYSTVQYSTISVPHLVAHGPLELLDGVHLVSAGEGREGGRLLALDRGVELVLGPAPRPALAQRPGLGHLVIAPRPPRHALCKTPQYSAVQYSTVQSAAISSRGLWAEKSFPKKLGKRIKDILLTLSNTKADSQGCEHEAHHGDEDGEGGPQPEAGQHGGEAGALVGGLTGSRERGEGVGGAGGARVVVRGHPQVVGGAGAQPAQRVHVLQLQTVGHCKQGSEVTAAPSSPAYPWSRPGRSSACTLSRSRGWGRRAAARCPASARRGCCWP